MGFFQDKVFISTDHSTILNIMQQSSIIFTSLTMRMSVCLVRAFQFLRGFCLIVQHKSGKEYVVLDALNKLANANSNLPTLDPNYNKLDMLFRYFAILVKMKLVLLKKIVLGYKANN